MSWVRATSGNSRIVLPSWGRCFWQDIDDGLVFLAYADDNEAYFTTSANSGVTWTDPKLAFHLDNFEKDDNFDTVMSASGDVHCAFKFNGSGCYQHLARSGVSFYRDGGERGFCDTADDGWARGFNGSLFSDEYKNDTDAYNDTALIHIVAKTSGITPSGTRIIHRVVSSPYNAPPELYLNATNEPSDRIGSITELPGESGGYPVITDSVKFRQGTEGRCYVVHYSTNGTGIMTCIGNRAQANHTWTSGNSIPVQELPFWSSWNPNTPGTTVDYWGGRVTRVPLGPTMTFGKGPHDVRNPRGYRFSPIITSRRPYISGVYDNNRNAGWEFLADMHDDNVSVESGVDFFGSMQSYTADDFFDSPRRRDTVNLEIDGASITFDRTGTLWAASDQSTFKPVPSWSSSIAASGSGTICDYTTGFGHNQINLYFNTVGADGAGVIQRLLLDIVPSNILSKVTTTQVNYSDIQTLPSGLQQFAFAQPEYAGDIGIWKSMKACRRQPGHLHAATPTELIAVVGSGSDSIGRLLVYNFANTLAGSADDRFKVPTYSFEHTAESGNYTFNGLSNYSMASGPEDVLNFFDGHVNTSGAISNGDSLTFEFTERTLVSRIEIAWNKLDTATTPDAIFPEITVEVSDDNVEFRHILKYDHVWNRATSEDGRLLIKLSSEYDGTFEDGWADDILWHNTLRGPISAKYLKLSFNGITGERDVREIRLYGPSTTSAKITTNANSDTDKWSIIRDYGITTTSGSFVETFNGIREFIDDPPRPPGWRVSGDWDWFVRASGAWARESTLPSEDTLALAPAASTGIVESGIYIGDSVGRYDGNALRTSEWIPLGSSGIVEKDIYIQAGELDEDGNAGRTISFDVRQIKVGAGVIIPADWREDDEFNFCISTFQNPILLDGAQTGIHTSYEEGPCFSNVCNWRTLKYNVEPGNWTLRWIWKRGNTPSLGAGRYPFPGEESVCWIDNIVGLDQKITGTNQVAGYVYAAPESPYSSIHSYVNKTFWGNIQSYMYGWNPFEPRHAYMEGAPNAFDNIPGYLQGPTEGYIQGYMLGGSGLLSYPTSSVLSYLPTFSGVKQSTYGFLLGMKQGQIHGYAHGLSETTDVSGIHGYVRAADGAAEIFATVNAGATGIYDSVHGHMQSLMNDFIAGYVKRPSGINERVHGYLAPQKISSIHGYMNTPLGSTTGSVKGYLKAIDGSSSINGYMFVSGDLGFVYGFTEGNSPNQYAHGYLYNAGDVSSVNAYMNVLEKEVINGYLLGNSFVSGTIHTWISGIGYNTSSVHSYLQGVSGIPTGTINSYLSAVEIPNESIYGTLIGYDTSPNCASFPLPAVSAVTIPSGNFFL